MGKRREAREAAVQYLVHCDLNFGSTPSAPIPTTHAPAPSASPEDVSPEPLESEGDFFWNLRPEQASAKVREMALELANGALSKKSDLDRMIAQYAENYQLQRIAAVDRNILRLAMYEMFFRDDIPPIVSINEAVEIAKRFGSEESGRFVNGILDRAKLELKRPLRTPESSETESKA